MNAEYVLGASASVELRDKVLNDIRNKRTSAKYLVSEYVDVGDYVAFWRTCFETLFLMNFYEEPSLKTESDGADDLRFFILKSSDTNGNPKIGITVRRCHDASAIEEFTHAISNIDWEETVYLNMISHSCRYYLTCAIMQKSTESEGKSELLTCFACEVFASPSKRRMDKKGSSEKITYPNIYFSVDDFDNAFEDLLLTPDQDLCVELVAEMSNGVSTVIFLGAVSYDSIKNAFANKNSVNGLFSGSFPFLSKRSKTTDVEFINMKGPNNTGRAQVAVTRLTEKTATEFNSRSSFSHSGGGSSRTTQTSSANFRSERAKPNSLLTQVTYVCVTCQHIMGMLLDTPKKPFVLTTHREKLASPSQ